MNLTDLHTLAYNSLLELSTDKGINASGKEEIYGCIFGRDSFLTILKILKALKRKPQDRLLKICKRSLLTLTSLQGKEFNVESGEQPGKFIHEFRTEKYEHLLKIDPPWYLYPDRTLRNYDSIDSTPLGLIAIFKYYDLTQDDEFLVAVLQSVEKGLNWLITYGDIDKDYLIEYEVPKGRKYGGLSIHSWADSHESLLQVDGSFPYYPIAAVEVQAYAWLALNLWGEFYLSHSPQFATKLLEFADRLKEEFNQSFILKDEDFYFAAQALAGDKKQITTITGNPLLCLFAAKKGSRGPESIFFDQYIKDLVSRAFLDDLFVPGAGIRTMSSKSPTFNPTKNSYHNGTFWPVLNGLAIEGLENFGFEAEAARLKQSSLQALAYFNTPIELYGKNEVGYFEYTNPQGHKGCRLQAWSAAALLEMTC